MALPGAWLAACGGDGGSAGAPDSHAGNRHAGNRSTGPCGGVDGRGTSPIYGRLSAARLGAGRR